MKGRPAPLFADAKGNFYDEPGWGALGSSGTQEVPLLPEDLIPLPPGSELMYLPGRLARGCNDEGCGDIGSRRRAVSAVLPVGYTRLFVPAYRCEPDAPVLPLYGYTAVAWYRGKVFAAARRTDDNAKWDPRRYNGKELKKLISAVKKELPENRLVDHLAHCSLSWHCCTAQNLFYRRWEAGIPTSPTCNADCIGCISLQPSECCPSPQTRISFSPTVEEVAAIGAYHLATAPEAIVSFGQGCEGEPALAADVIAPAVLEIRRRTKAGILNINTNAGYVDGIRQVTDAGMDSFRVSLISAGETLHRAYYRSNYTMEDVKASIRFMRSKKRVVSVNMLLFPGLNDQPDEVNAWIDFLKETGVEMVQLRNLNIDPDVLRNSLPAMNNGGIGIRNFITRMQEDVPGLRIGNFSHFQA